MILLSCALSAEANLIEIVPPNPGGPSNWAHATFFDEAAHGWFNTPNGPEYFNGWVSRYGKINGGQFFFTNLFDFAATNTAEIWWDFTPSPYWLTYVTTWGRGPSGEFLEKTYEVHFTTWEMSAGHEMVNLPDGYEIHSIAFYGTNFVPEPSTPALLAFGILAIPLLRRLKVSQVHVDRIR